MYSHKKTEKDLELKMGLEDLTLYKINNNQRNWNYNDMIICSMDPGEINFAIRIERRSYTLDLNSKFILNFVIPIYYERINIHGNDQTSTYSILTEHLDTIFHIVSRCNIFLIEKQVPKNYKCVRINQHIISYLLLKLSSSEINPLIYDLHPNLKYKSFGIDKQKMTKYEKKQKSVMIAKDFLSKVGDQWSLTILENDKVKGKIKGEDLADTVTQMEAFFIKIGYSNYTPPANCILSKDSLSVIERYNQNISQLQTYGFNI